MFWNLIKQKLFYLSFLTLMNCHPLWAQINSADLQYFEYLWEKKISPARSSLSTPTPQLINRAEGRSLLLYTAEFSQFISIGEQYLEGIDDLEKKREIENRLFIVRIFLYYSYLRQSHVSSDPRIKCNFFTRAEFQKQIIQRILTFSVFSVKEEPSTASYPQPVKWNDIDFEKYFPLFFIKTELASYLGLFLNEISKPTVSGCALKEKSSEEALRGEIANTVHSKLISEVKIRVAKMTQTIADSLTVLENSKSNLEKLSIDGLAKNVHRLTKSVQDTSINFRLVQEDQLQFESHLQEITSALGDFDLSDSAQQGRHESIQELDTTLKKTIDDLNLFFASFTSDASFKESSFLQYVSTGEASHLNKDQASLVKSMEERNSKKKQSLILQTQAFGESLDDFTRRIFGVQLK